MAATLENLVNFERLTYYDGKIKQYIANALGEQTSFVGTGTLPAQGEEGVLYVTDDTIKYWDGTKYVDVGGTSSGSSGTTGDMGNWGKF